MVSPDTVARVVDRLTVLPDEDAQMIVTHMSEEQPALLAYLLATSENAAFDQDEGEAVFFIGLVIYEIMKEAVKDLPIITEEQLAKAEKANEDLLEKMGSDSAGDFISVADSVIADHPEPEVLRYMTEALMEDEDGNPENPPLREEGLGLAYLNLKIFLDALAKR